MKSLKIEGVSGGNWDLILSCSAKK